MQCTHPWHYDEWINILEEDNFMELHNVKHIEDQPSIGSLSFDNVGFESVSSSVEDTATSMADLGICTL